MTPAQRVDSGICCTAVGFDPMEKEWAVEQYRHRGCCRDRAPILHPRRALT